MKRIESNGEVCFEKVNGDLFDNRCSRKSLNDEIVAIISPLFDKSNPTNQICHFLSQHCQSHPRSSAVTDFYGKIAQRVLKHNMDFGKCPKMRNLVQDYIIALSQQNDGFNLIRNFVKTAHGFGITCPHPRILPNLVSICLAAVSTLFEEKRNYLNSSDAKNRIDCLKEDELFRTKLDCIVTVFDEISNFEDWRPLFSQLLQPIPFPDLAIADEGFTSPFKSVIRKISSDVRCDVHQMILGIREEKEGWFHVYCPGNIACDDDGDLWSLMLNCLINCCCRRKSFLWTLNKCLGPCMLRALRDDETCQETLCAMLELDVVENKDMQLQIITTLQSTKSGKLHYAALCQRQLHLKELQQKGGPRKLTLPSRSTDTDVARLLSCGSFGNLECLSLAFTQVTSACAEQLVKLPSLRYLNLWSTQFGDSGLELISEHLHKLQVLNLCETPVTDKGLKYLSAMKNLRKLNLNSTSLTAHTFEGLKQTLPALQECDIRYTDACI
ncbi:C-Maf-inducing protein-like protein [Leptotrombidium deliense]|uniref:C-Maf-inducing protein-like protein n=1 Tax=Leptotrombidium deliense TaxID=299467 RepID=A0A443SBF6_9ACAR|nr:C-Maf-inducing protein-like protein [Leptotrombidium deliense]